MEKAGWGHISKRWIWYTPLCCNQPLSFILQTVIVYPNFEKKKNNSCSLLTTSILKPGKESHMLQAFLIYHSAWSPPCQCSWPFFSLIRKTFKCYHYCCPGKPHLIDGTCPVHDTYNINQDWILFQFIMVAVQMKKCLYRKSVLQYKCANDVITDFRQKEKKKSWFGLSIFPTFLLNFSLKLNITK